jgi:hypothetical protein
MHHDEAPSEEPRHSQMRHAVGRTSSGKSESVVVSAEQRVAQQG